jgi:hypothetical protein
VVELIDLPGVLSEACRPGLIPVVSGLSSQDIIFTCPSTAASASKGLRDRDCAWSVEIYINQSGSR